MMRLQHHTPRERVHTDNFSHIANIEAVHRYKTTRKRNASGSTGSLINLFLRPIILTFL